MNLNYSDHISCFYRRVTFSLLSADPPNPTRGLSIFSIGRRSAPVHMRSPKNQLCAAEPPPSCRTNNIPKRLLSRKQLIAMPPIVARGRSRMVNADIIHCPTNTVDKRTDNRFYGTNSCSVSSGNGSLPPTTVPIKFLERQFIVFASPCHSLYIFLRSRFLTLTLYRCFSRPKRRIQRRKSKDFSQLQKWLRRISRINARSYRKYRESRERG